MARILVVDDDPSSLELVCTFLGKSGFTVQGVPNGREALEKILKWSPELVVLDLLMPELDGGGLLEILRSYLRLQTLPVIVFTALSDNPEIERARNFKVKTILQKGKATLTDLGQAVELALHG